MSKFVDPVNPYKSEHPYKSNPEDKALKIKYFNPDSLDFILSLSKEANIYNDKDCSSKPK